MSPGAPVRPHRFVLLACVIAMVLHQATRWGWTIDDAAICFAYARNFVDGYGLVPTPGAERVEAYSDPAWVFVLALFQAVGLNGFQVAKPLGMAFGAGTLWIVWRTAALAMPEHRGPGALFAPVVLAMSAQFAIWSASGLENGLFCVLLAGAIHRTVLELQHGGRPWASVVYFLLAWTRPEGVLYAAVGGAWFLIGTLRRRRSLLPVGQWLAVFWVPTLLLELGRLAYFAWPLPNTYYAKITSRGVSPLDWDGRGWSQLRDWADRLWQGFFVPVYLLGLTGPRGPRFAAGAAIVSAIALSLAWPGPEALRALWFWPGLPDPPTAFVTVRALLLGLAGLGLPLLAIGRPGEDARVLCGVSTTVGLLFSVVSDGDWMGAYRFMSLVAPALAVLLGVGLCELCDAIEARVSGGSDWSTAGWLAATLGLALVLPPNLSQTRDHIQFNIAETTTSVKLRVDHTRGALRRTFHDGPITNLEVDQGAHLWWAPDYAEVDMAMLVDIPMSRHWYQQRRFVHEYVFEERRPTFAHVGGWWAKYTGLRNYDLWDVTYFELPPYQNVRPPGPFRNVFARRDLVMTERWAHPVDRRAVFQRGVVIEGFDLPAPWTPGRPGYLEVPMSQLAARKEGEGVRVWAFVSDGEHLASFELPPGYGFYPMPWWRPSEVFRGRHAVPVPASLPPGRYDLGFVIVGVDGRVLPVQQVPPGAVTDTPRVAAGEVRFPGAIEIVAASEHAQRTNTARSEVMSRATALECDGAERAFTRLQRHHPTDWTWHASERPAAATAIADCFAVRAGQAGDAAPDLLARAKGWDPKSEELLHVGGPVAERLLQEGHDARAAEDWETAYRRYAAVLSFQPWRAWARRWAEEARDHRLGLVDDVRIGIGGEHDLRRWEEEHAEPPAR